MLQIKNIRWSQQCRQKTIVHAQWDQHVRCFIDEAREAREQEATLIWEEMQQNAAFNKAFIGVFGEIASTMTQRNL